MGQCLSTTNTATIAEVHSRSDKTADDVVDILLCAKTQDEKLTLQLNDAVEAQGWTEDIAKAILLKLAAIIEDGNSILGPIIQDTLDKVRPIVDEIFKFVRDHPVAVTIFCILLAIGVLWYMCPWVLGVLGFSSEGPIAGSWAAIWQAMYRGYVPARSLFAYLQRLAMIWPTAVVQSGGRMTYV